MNAATGKPDRILMAILSAIALLVIVALAVVFTRGEPAPLDESTPQGVVQRYSTAVIDGDTATANSFLTEAASSLCAGFRDSGPLPTRVVLISATERDNSALVRVSVVNSGSGGPFGPSEYSLLERLFSTGAVLASTDVAGVARSLAFALIGGPLAALLWWAVWKRLDDGAERSSVGWGLYLSAVYAVSLITAVTALLGMAASFIGRGEPQWYSPLSNGLVWAGIFIWHRWMWRHPVKRPVNLAEVPAVIGSVFGLVVAGSPDRGHSLGNNPGVAKARSFGKVNS